MVTDTKYCSTPGLWTSDHYLPLDLVLLFPLFSQVLYEGEPKKSPELSSGGQAPCSTGFPQ